MISKISPFSLEFQKISSITRTIFSHTVPNSNVVIAKKSVFSEKNASRLAVQHQKRGNGEAIHKSPPISPRLSLSK